MSPVSWHFSVLDRPLVAILHRKGIDITMLRNAVWTVSNCCRGKPPPPFGVVKEALTGLSKAIWSEDDEVVRIDLHTLLLLPRTEFLQHVDKAMISPQLRQDADTKTVFSNVVCCTVADHQVADACWALSYLSDGDNHKLQAVIDAGVLTQVVRLLEHKAPSVVTPALRILGNLVTGDDIRTQQVLDASPDEVWKAVHFL